MVIFYDQSKPRIDHLQKCLPIFLVNMNQANAEFSMYNQETVDTIGIDSFPALQLYRNGTTYMAFKSLNDTEAISQLLRNLMPITTRVRFPKDPTEMNNLLTASKMTIILFHVSMIPNKQTVLDKYDALSLKYPDVRFLAIDGQHGSFAV